MATKTYQEYKRREEALKRNAKRRDWERKNAGKSYAQIKREEMDRKFLAWVIGGVAGFAGWLVLFAFGVSFAIVVGLLIGGVTGTIAGIKSRDT